MIYTIENEKYSARVNTRGAELTSLYLKSEEREYLWQAAKEAWPDHSLLLFPCCGRIDRSRIIANGREYPLAMHGFAKDMEFSVLESRRDYLKLRLSYNEDTMRQFPYEFILDVEFEAGRDGIEQRFTVRTEGDRVMPFSLGAHPGFFCPVDLESEADDMVLEFDSKQDIKKFGLEPGTRLIKPDDTSVFLSGKTVRLSDTFFNNGPMVLGNVNAKTIKLKSRKTGRFVEIGIEGFPFMTLWGVGERMTIIAIEPWCGTSDVSGTDHVWEKKYGNEKVAPGKKFERALKFRLG